jgi:hypothetical protein
MQIAPQLTAEEFSDLHNAKCEIHGISETLVGVLHPDLQKRLESAVAKINAALKNAYEQDNAISEKRSAHYNKVASDHKFDTIWSVHEVDDLYMPHPFEGVTHVRYSEHWGSADVTVPIKGNTWVDLWRAAETAINESGDNHHIFIEDFEVADYRPDFLRLSTGS